jgi:hypothetical protein
MSATKILLGGPCLHAYFSEQSGETSRPRILAMGREGAAFRFWVDSLPTEGNEELMQLRGCGFSYDIDELEAELFRALRDGPAGPLARIVGQRLLDLLADHRDAACIFMEQEGE